MPCGGIREVLSSMVEKQVYTLLHGTFYHRNKERMDVFQFIQKLTHQGFIKILLQS